MKRVSVVLVLGLLMIPVSASGQAKPKTPPPQKPAQTKPAKPAVAPAEGAVDAFLKTRQLERAYNPVLLEYLLEEGRPRLTPAQHKLALDQIVSRFKAEIDIKPSAQITASLATLAGVLTPGVVGEGISEGAGSVWASWVDAANLLVKAGHAEAATPFLENCVKTNPYPDLRSRCTVGLAAANPTQAMAILTGLLDRKNPEEVINTSLRMLGDLAGAADCPPEQRDAAIKELTARAQGILNATFYEAAIDGLERAKDARGIEPIRKLTGATKGEAVSRAAKRALLLTFKDPAIVETLRKDAKGGFMKTDDDRFYAGMLLIRAGDEAGYAYARDQLTRKRGGFFSSSKAVDYRPTLVDVLVTYGGSQAVPVLQAGLAVQKGDEWLRAYIAIGLLELGDTTGIDDARRALANTNWTHTRVRAAEGLAKHRDTSGIAVLTAMAQDPGLLRKAADIMSGKDIDYEAMRVAIARALGRMDVAEGVPLLGVLVADKAVGVRLAAAYAIARMTNPAALDAYPAAMAQEYGQDQERSRTPEVLAHLVRSAAMQFPKEPRTKALLDAASKSDIGTVRFLAMVAPEFDEIRVPFRARVLQINDLRASWA